MPVARPSSCRRGWRRQRSVPLGTGLDEFNGRVSAIQEVQLRPRVSGYIDRVAYKEGDEVRAGDLLFVIDPRPYHDVLDSAVAQLERARATAALAQTQNQRAQTLIAAKAISREEFDSRQAGLARLPLTCVPQRRLLQLRSSISDLPRYVPRSPVVQVERC